MDYKTLTSERFVLKILQPYLVGQEYLSWFSNEKSTSYISYSKNEVSLNSLKTYVQEKYDSKDAIFFGIFLKEGLHHIGNIKFEPIDFDNHYAVLGILIGNLNWQGVGVFSEISAVLESSLKKDGIEKIFLGVDKENVNAVKAYFKQGYIVDESNFLNANLSKSYCLVKKIT